MLQSITEFLELKVGGRSFAEFLVDWKCKIADMIDYEHFDIETHLAKMNATIELVESQSPDDEGYNFYVLKFYNATDSVYIKLESMNSSYHGNVFMNWHVVKPVEVIKIEYQNI